MVLLLPSPLPGGALVFLPPALTKCAPRSLPNTPWALLSMNNLSLKRRSSFLFFCQRDLREQLEHSRGETFF